MITKNTMEKNHFSQIESPKNVKSFGLLPDGKEILCYTLQNKNGALMLLALAKACGR